MSKRDVVVIVALVGVGLIAAGYAWVERSDDTLDDRAHELIARAGDLCRAFDFQLKGTAAGEEFRPVNCKNPGSNRVLFTLYAFESAEGRSQWVQDWKRTQTVSETTLLIGDDWTAEPGEINLTGAVHDRLGGELIETVYLQLKSRGGPKVKFRSSNSEAVRND